MLLMFKIVAIFLSVSGINIFIGVCLDHFGLLNNCIALMLVIGMLLVQFMLIYIKVVGPLCKLHSALSVIDFNKDIIDFSKLDSLEVKGFKELIEIQNKFKYLLDIITERINRVNSQTYKSEHDELTGCYNRVHLETVKSTYEIQNSVYVIFIDVNNLKRMNDDFGHEAGDALLKHATHKLNYWQNYGDVYRMGGDEFMVVITNKSKEYVDKLISLWYPSVGVLNRDSDGFKCVLSYGVAYGLRNCDFDSLQKHADEEMYKMKIAIKKKFGEPLR